MKRGINFSLKNLVGKRGQIWVETVIYTLIAFIIIGMVLSFVKPKIEEFQDKAIIEQSIEVIKEIDSTIKEIERGGEGNKRLVQLGIKKGVLKLNGENDSIIFEMESRCEYSEPGENYLEGNINVLTEKKGKFYLVILTRDYSSDYNITYQEEDKLKTISKTSTSYKLLISNNGGEDKIIIDIKIT